MPLIMLICWPLFRQDAVIVVVVVVVVVVVDSYTQEYEFFFEMKFGKKPKLTKKTM